MKVFFNKRFISIILISVILFTFIQLPENIVYGAVSYSGQTDVGNYTIGTTSQLDLLSQRVNSGTTYEGSTFMLTKNITYDSSMVNNFTPIGGYHDGGWNSTISSFNGIFDGNGFYISGINIYYENIEQKNNEQSYKGIFGRVQNATIKNLGLVNSTIQAHNYIGGICGYAIRSTIENCYNDSTIQGGKILNNSQLHSQFMIGGLAGYSSESKFINCFNTGRVAGQWNAGIVGKAYSNTQITNCENKGIVGHATKYSSTTAGIVSYLSGSNVYGCSNTGTIITFTHGWGQQHAGIVATSLKSTIKRSVNYSSIGRGGGIVALLDESTVEECENYGNITGGSGIASYSDKGVVAYCANFGNVQGGAGIVNGTSRGKIYFSYNTGNVTQNGYKDQKSNGDWYTVYAYPAGILGFTNNVKYNAGVYGCYSTGNITGNLAKPYGLVGYGELGSKKISISDSYYLDNNGTIDYASIVDEFANHKNTREKTSDEMKLQEFVDLLNEGTRYYSRVDNPFKKSNSKNNGYPILWYQLTVENITIEGSSIVNKGDTTVLKAIITPENAPNKNITWTTSDNSIADIIPVGEGNSVIIQGIRKGTVTITAKAQDGSGVKASKTINVVTNFTSSEANYILIDDVIDYVTAWKDTESDPLYKEEYRYIQTPNSFKDGIKVDNTMGYISYHNAWQSNVYNHFSKVGTYKIQYRVQDNPPTANKINFNNYRYYSDYVENTIYVHRKPIAIYTITDEVVSDLSYDLDHSVSYSNKGIAKWEWTCVSNTGIIEKYTVTNKKNGVNSVNTWINTYKTVGYKIILRVQDIEGSWSEPCIKGAGEYSKPIAFFTIDKNPMIYPNDTQIITDMSYDTNGSGLTLTYDWTVEKDGTNILNSTNKDISTTLNQKIKAIYPNIIGIYEIKLKVTNNAGIESNIFTKSFEVKIENSAPTVNFNLVSNQNPVWTFPKTLGLYTLRYRPSNTLFFEEYTRFDTNVNDPNTDNTGFIYNWKLERFAVKDINNISGTATNTYNYTTQFPFVNSFKNQGLGWGAYKITLKVTDKPPIPPYTSADSKSMEVTKYYYIVPEISLVESFESSKTEIMVGDTVTLKAKTNKLVNNVDCIFNGVTYNLGKKSEDSSFIYWEKDIVIPESITESGTYNLQFIGKTIYGGNGNVTREVRDNTPIDIIALKLINFRITNIVNHIPPTYNFPYRYEKGELPVQDYKTGYYVTFQIDSKGKPDNVHGRIDVGNNGTIEQNISMTKIVTGDTETWQGRFYTQALLPPNTVISIKLDCKKGTTTYNYNEKENWNGRSLIINGSALQDGRINLTN